MSETRCYGCGRAHPVLPGKFEGAPCPVRAAELYAEVLDGLASDEAGSIGGFGCTFALVSPSNVPGARHAVVTEDAQGFVTFEAFPSAAAARRAFDAAAAEVDAWERERDEGDE